MIYISYLEENNYICREYFEMLQYQVNKGRLHIAKPLPFS